MKLLADISLITKEDIVIVANNRQILAFKKQYSNNSTLQIPQILSWNNLLNTLWEKSDKYLNSQLINNEEINYIFYQIIKKSDIKESINTINEIYTNYSWHRKQQIPLAEFIPQNIMQEHFVKWLRSYQAIKQKNNLIDIFDLAEINLANNYTKIQYYQYGFRALTNQQKQLFTQLQTKIIQIPTILNKFNHKIFSTVEDEIKSASKWAYDLRKKSDKTIAIIVPELEKSQYLFEKEFNQNFSEEFSQTKDKSFNISIGKTLISYNIIKDLILILKITQQMYENKIQVSEILQLLNSAYIGGNSHQKLIVPILKLEKSTITVEQLIAISTDNKFLLAIFTKKQTFDKKYHDDWLITFENILNTWQFNQARKMTSDEYQIFNKYLNSSLIFNKLARLAKKISLSAAINDLIMSLTNIIFQPQASLSQIQILGSLEAEGLSFDHTWIVGINNKVLPYSLNPPRYIPVDLCKKYKIPRCDFKHIMTDSNNSLQLLSISSNCPIISYAKTINDTEILGSSLLKWDKKLTQFTTIKPEKVTIEYTNEKVKKLENLNIKSGIKTLQNQIQCPFKGFTNRLYIDSFEDEYLGINNLNKGNILHRSLELLYREVNTKNKLENLTQNKLVKIVHLSINNATTEFNQDSFLEIEKARVFTKIMDFLVLEKKRDNWQITRLEQTQKIQIDKLNFKIKIDRIDKNDTGEYIIFDYKSGKVSTKSWCTDNINEIQLPIYALNNSASAICFISFKDDIKYLGMAKNTEILNQKAKCCDDNSWNEQLSIWKNLIHQAATDFQNGKAEVSPNKGACNYCKLDAFCRVESKI